MRPFNFHSVAEHQKIEAGPFGNFFFEKSLTMSKKSEGHPLVSPGNVCYAEKHKKPFWFSLLSQMFQFGTIKFCRTFKSYFGQFVWIEKRVTIIVITIIVNTFSYKNELIENDDSGLYCNTLKI